MKQANQEMMLVIGANGTVGSELVGLLRKQNFRVRATTSKAVPFRRAELDIERSDLTPNVLGITGSKPRSLAQYANDFRNAWVK
ncbi:MAG: SDR family oxidoreductase [Bdellovibrionales bacterium]|nr:SDR family oxidoreductase [Bdellovibrionales bacterium]